MNKINVFSVFALILYLLMFPFIDDALGQIDIKPPEPIDHVNRDIQYVPDGEYKWILEKTNYDESITIDCLSSYTNLFTITPTSQLSLNDCKNYPVEIFSLERDIFGNVINRIDYDYTDFGLIADRLDLTIKNNFAVTIPQNIKFNNLYMKIGPNSSTYSAVTNTITVTGGTAGTPINFEDVYNASVAGGWGVVTKTAGCAKCYCFTAKLNIGASGTTTYFADTKKTVTFGNNSTTTNGDTLIKIYDSNTTHFTLGWLNDAILKITSVGVDLYDENTENTITVIDSGEYSDLNLYDCTIEKRVNSISNYCNIRGISHNCYNLSTYNCTIVRIYNNADLDDIRILVDPSVTGGTILNDLSTIYHLNDVFVYDTNAAVFGFTINPSDVSNVVAINNNRAVSGLFCGGTFSITNSYLDSWINGGLFSSQVLYRRYTFDLKVTDGNLNPLENAHVIISDSHDNIVTDIYTSSSGTIPQQSLLHSTIPISSGSTSYTPHELTISLDGYDTYHTHITANEEKDWKISLTDTSELTGFIDMFGYDGDSTIDSMVIWLGGNIMLIALLLALACTLAAWHVGSFMLHFISACFWTGAGILILIEPPWENYMIGQFFAWPAIGFGIYLLFTLAIHMFSGKYRDNS